MWAVYMYEIQSSICVKNALVLKPEPRYKCGQCAALQLRRKILFCPDIYGQQHVGTCIYGTEISDSYTDTYKCLPDLWDSRSSQLSVGHIILGSIRLYCSQDGTVAYVRPKRWESAPSLQSVTSLNREPQPGSAAAAEPAPRESKRDL
jgi:hypothetical protein